MGQLKREDIAAEERCFPDYLSSAASPDSLTGRIKSLSRVHEIPGAFPQSFLSFSPVSSSSFRSRTALSLRRIFGVPFLPFALIQSLNYFRFLVLSQSSLLLASTRFKNFKQLRHCRSPLTGWAESNRFRLRNFTWRTLDIL